MGLERIEYQGKALVKVIAMGSAVTVGQDTYQSDLTRTYLQLTLLNSFPTVNANGMTLLPPLIAKAVSTANNQPLNLDHQAEGNEPVFQGTNIVVGSMLKAYYASTGDIQLLPDVSDPLKVIAVIWNRFAESKKIIASIGDGEKQYGVSFEIIFAMDESGWVVYGENGPSYETEINDTLMNAFKAKEYNKVALAVGGDGSGNSTHIWGGGFTLIPADGDAGIDAILTGNFQPNAAIATIMDHKIEPKEPIMKMNMKLALAKFNKALAQSGFSVQVTGGDALTLDLAGTEIKQPDDFSIYAYRKSNGDYYISASLYMEKPGIDGFKEKVRLEYEPSADDSGEFTMTEVETANAKVKTPRELAAQIETMTQEIAGFKGFLSPSEVQVKVDEAVAAAKGAAPTGDEGDLITQKQVDTQIKDAMAQRDAVEASMVSRSEKLESDGFTLTDERKSHLATFTADEAGNVAFNAWLADLKTAQVAMLKDLDAKDIEPTDNIKAAVACLNGINDSGYTALVASRGSDPPTFTPSMAAAGDFPSGDGDFKRVM